MKYLTCTITAVLSMLNVAACSDSPATPDVQYLASDLHLMVGGHRITVPAVALRGSGHTFDLNRQRPEKSLKETLKLAASDPDHPMTIDKLDLVIRQYQYTDESLASLDICPRLKRTWSQVQCRGQQRGLLKRLPEQFDLLDRGKLDLLENHSIVQVRCVYQFRHARTGSLITSADSAAKQLCKISPPSAAPAFRGTRKRLPA